MFLLQIAKDLLLLVIKDSSLSKDNILRSFKMEELKTKRIVGKQQFTRAENSLRRLLESGGGLEDTIQRKFGELSSKWQAVQDAHDIYVAQAGKEINVNEETLWIGELEERFDAIEIDADSALLKFKTAKKLEIADRQEDKNGRSMDKDAPLRGHLQLERLKLEKFDGELRNYPSFKERFGLYIEPICPVSQLPFILRQHLGATVREEVENVEDDMACLWERLDLKYANHTKFVDIVLSDLENTSKGDAKSALKLINTVEKAYNDLHKIGAAQEMANATVISMIKKRFPDEMRLDWVKTIASKGEEESATLFKMLLEFLKQWRQMIECDDQVIKRQEKKSGVTHLAGLRSGGGTSYRKSEACWLHEDNGNHPIWKCNAFRAMPLKEKLDLVVQNKACKACLEISCKGAENAEACGRYFKCNVDRCGKPHNSLIHE